MRWHKGPYQCRLHLSISISLRLVRLSDIQNNKRSIPYVPKFHIVTKWRKIHPFSLKCIRRKRTGIGGSIEASRLRTQMVMNTCHTWGFGKFYFRAGHTMIHIHSFINNEFINTALEWIAALNDGKPSKPIIQHLILFSQLHRSILEVNNVGTILSISTHPSPSKEKWHGFCVVAGPGNESMPLRFIFSIAALDIYGFLYNYFIKNSCMTEQ